MDKKFTKKHMPKPLLIILIVISVLLVFLLFPRRERLKDGGTVTYESFGFGAIYTIEKRHEIYSENGTDYYIVGTVIYVFGHEIYNNSHVDYDHPYNERVSDEELEEIRALVTSFMEG